MQTDRTKRCTYCGLPLDDESATKDHAKPKSHGGKNQASNILRACYSCNQLRGTMPVDAFRAWMLPVKTARKRGLPLPKLLDRPSSNADSDYQQWGDSIIVRSLGQLMGEGRYATPYGIVRQIGLGRAGVIPIHALSRMERNSWVERSTSVKDARRISAFVYLVTAHGRAEYKRLSNA